jgi:tubulin polyglutamylase TTLL5
MKDDTGSKQSIAALRKKLKKLGVDDKILWAKIDDIIVKTIISAENVINNGVDMFCPFKTNCFELFGFDILIDSKLEPWLIEVNLTPALSCDTPLDQKIKANVISDLFTLAGIMHLD